MLSLRGSRRSVVNQIAGVAGVSKLSAMRNRKPSCDVLLLAGCGVVVATAS